VVGLAARRPTGAIYGATARCSRRPGGARGLEIECIDRMYLNIYVPQLQREHGLIG
jgi:hypothetical protein